MVAFSLGFYCRPTSYGRDILRGIVSRQKLGRVRSRSRSGCPSQFIPKCRAGSGRPSRLLEFSRKSGKILGQSWLSPIFEHKRRGESGLSLTFPNVFGQFSQKVGINWGEMPTSPTFCSRQSRWPSGPVPKVGINRAGHPNLNRPCLPYLNNFPSFSRNHWKKCFSKAATFFRRFPGLMG